MELPNVGEMQMAANGPVYSLGYQMELPNVGEVQMAASKPGYSLRYQMELLLI